MPARPDRVKESASAAVDDEPPMVLLARRMDDSIPARPEYVTRLLHEAKRLEPHLQQRVWPPMSYMGIPSLLKRIDRILAALMAWSVPDAQVLAAVVRLATLRHEFRRER